MTRDDCMAVVMLHDVETAWNFRPIAGPFPIAGSVDIFQQEARRLVRGFRGRLWCVSRQVV